MQSIRLWRDHHGIAHASVIEDAGYETDLDPRFDLANHSPTGFEWGYHGSGPAQLAVAICAAVLGDDERACAIAHVFKSRFVATIAREVTERVLPFAELRAQIVGLETARAKDRHR